MKKAQIHIHSIHKHILNATLKNSCLLANTTKQYSIMLYKKLISCTLLLLMSVMLHAQIAERSILSTAGNLFATESISLEFTIGDIAIKTLNSEVLILTQGFLQPNNPATISIKSIHQKLKWNIYPNPATTYINLSFSQILHTNKYKVDIHDLNGRLVLENKLIEQNNNIDISELQPGTYLVKIKNNNQYLSSAQILQKIK